MLVLRKTSTFRQQLSYAFLFTFVSLQFPKIRKNKIRRFFQEKLKYKLSVL